MYSILKKKTNKILAIVGLGLLATFSTNYLDNRKYLEVNTTVTSFNEQAQIDFEPKSGDKGTVIFVSSKVPDKNEANSPTIIFQEVTKNSQENSSNINFINPDENSKVEINNDTSLTNGMFTIIVEDSIQNLKFRAIKNELTESLVNILGEDTDFYKLYLENQEGDAIELRKKAKIEITIKDNKTIEGIYAMGSDNILEPLDLSIKDGKAYVEVETLANIVVDYATEKEESKLLENDTQDGDKNNEEKNHRANYNMITIGAMLIASGVTGLVLAKRKNINKK